MQELPPDQGLSDASRQDLPSRPWRWLESTKRLQEYTYGYFFHEGDDQKFPRTVSEYLNWNQIAAVQELAEVREEFSWKPWATDPPFVNRIRVMNEIVDVLHFLGNMLVAVNVTDEQLEVAYKAKQNLNRSRFESGTYSAKKGGLAEGSDSGG